jgi:hypothetical protein
VYELTFGSLLISGTLKVAIEAIDVRLGDREAILVEAAIRRVEGVAFRSTGRARETERATNMAKDNPPNCLNSDRNSQNPRYNVQACAGDVEGYLAGMPAAVVVIKRGVGYRRVSLETIRIRLRQNPKPKLNFNVRLFKEVPRYLQTRGGVLWVLI